jgi:hypothetical protein
MSSRTTTVNRIPITQARVNLGAVVKRVHLNGDISSWKRTAFPWPG